MGQSEKPVRLFSKISFSFFIYESIFISEVAAEAGAAAASLPNVQVTKGSNAASSSGTVHDSSST